MTTYDAILPAGGRIDPDFAKAVGTNSKALICLKGTTILDQIINALKETGCIGRIILIGGEEVRNAAENAVDEILPEGATGPDNIRKGLKHLMESPNPPDKVLIVTSDLPFLTKDMITGFLDRCPTTMDVCVPIVRRAEYERRFPNSSSTWVPLADDQWTMGGIFLVDVKALQRAMPQIDRAFDNRKSVLGMAKLLGPTFIWRYLRKSLTVKDIEAKIMSMLGCTGTAVMDVAPELAYDIDALDDYTYAMEHQV